MITLEDKFKHLKETEVIIIRKIHSHNKRMKESIFFHKKMIGIYNHDLDNIRREIDKHGKEEVRAYARDYYEALKNDMS